MYQFVPPIHLNYALFGIRTKLAIHHNVYLTLFSSEVTEEMVSLVNEIFKARLEKNKAEVSKKTTTLEVQQSKSEMI